ncbi:GNAT family N-acetyltransferase, partial [Salmonella enterica subsp. enterica serovar Kentucky]|nr:GNAT family N-acetyltransferase [Salmonella enterica subsp. enterica serovar Kentucky]
ATCMFARHGLLALLAGRFLAFVRTLLPTMAGISGPSNRRFQFYMLLEHLIDELEKRGVVTLWLEVRASNAAAIALYESLGFNEAT